MKVIKRKLIILDFILRLYIISVIIRISLPFLIFILMKRLLIIIAGISWSRRKHILIVETSLVPLNVRDLVIFSVLKWRIFSVNWIKLICMNFFLLCYRLSIIVLYSCPNIWKSLNPKTWLFWWYWSLLLLNYIWILVTWLFLSYLQLIIFLSYWSVNGFNLNGNCLFLNDL